MHRWLAFVPCLSLLGCAGGGADQPTLGNDGAIDGAASHDGGAPLDGSPADSPGPADDGATSPDAGGDANGAADGDASGPVTTCSSSGDAGAGCYAITCNAGGVHTLQANRDRLVADLAKRKCTDSCTLWGDLNQAERYIFLMDTTYLGDTSSRLYPPSYSNLETALDHAVAL